MKYAPKDSPIETCITDNFGGRRWDDHSQARKDLKLLTLVWRLIKIFFRYGNCSIYFHICGSLGKDYYDTPMNAENVEVRIHYEPKVTIW